MNFHKSYKNIIGKDTRSIEFDLATYYFKLLSEKFENNEENAIKFINVQNSITEVPIKAKYDTFNEYLEIKHKYDIMERLDKYYPQSLSFSKKKFFEYNRLKNRRKLKPQ